MPYRSPRFICHFFLGLLAAIGSGAFSIAEEYAFLVGVNDYDPNELRSLPYARADILEFREVLIASGYKPDNIVMMVDDMESIAKTKPAGRYLPEASKIAKELALLISNLDRNDSIVIAFAGHGVQFKGEDVAYFCPSDAKLSDPSSLVSVSAIYRQLDYDKKTEKGCKARQRILLVDACRNDPKSSISRNSNAPTLESVTRPQLTPPPEGTVVLFSCAEGQEAREHEPLKHGVFFYHVLEAWRGKADDGDRQLTVDELIAYTKSKTQSYVRTKLGVSQTPRQQGSFSGEWVLRSLKDSLEGSRVGDIREVESLGMKLVWIPAGRFTMGSPITEEGHRDDENQVEVTLTQGYWLGQTELTQGQWKAVMGTEPWKGEKYVKEGANYPATYVSWEDAMSYLKTLTARERRSGALPVGWEYSLPSEAQWEYACRGGRETAYSFGDNASQLGQYGWFKENADSVKEEYAHEVGKKLPNEFGLRDMHGNVWEWCNDSYVDKLIGGVNPVIENGGSFRVDRGGGWNGTAKFCRSADRDGSSPDYRYSNLGFRVSLVPTAK